MTVHDLHDAIGLLDEELLEETDRLRTAPRKQKLPIRRYWAAAACLVMLLGGTLAYWFVSNTLRCGSAAPAQFNMQSAPMENAAEAQRSAEDSSAPEAAPENKSPATNSAKTESAEEAPAPASGGIGMDQGERSEPPVLVIDHVTLTSGNYTWTVQQEGGTARTVTACGAHPMDDLENLPMLCGGSQDITLDWPAAPDSVTVRCWQVGQDQSQEQEAVLDGNTLSSQPGDWVYEVCAKFEQGEATYAFRRVRE